MRPAGAHRTCRERSELDYQAAVQPGSSRRIVAMPRAGIERSRAATGAGLLHYSGARTRFEAQAGDP